jgi:CheY-like chemotaxis protein
MLSATDNPDTIVHCIMLGADDYVAKPFNPVLLRARIRASLEKYRLRQERTPRLRVFISSPGDVNPERAMIRRLIGRLNQELTGQVYLVPMLWEDEPLRATETFQSQLELPKDADIYLGIFWSRLGQPLPGHIQRKDGTQYLSGSEFEFEDAYEGFQQDGKPEMLVYRKTAVPTVDLSDRQAVLDRLEQKDRVEAFIKNWFFSEDGTFKGAFYAFESESQLEEMLESHLRKLALKLVSS